MPHNTVLFKQREIYLRGPMEPSLDITEAVRLVAAADGVLQCQPLNDHTLNVRYNLQQISLQQLETALAEVGFHLDNSLFNKLKRALYYYTEDNERQNLGLGKLNCTNGCAVKVFAALYREADHGCRDPRPGHLRHYH